MTNEWSDIEALPDFATISLSSIVVIFAALMVPYGGYQLTTATKLFELFGSVWFSSLGIYYVLTKWEAAQHALADNIVAVTAGFLFGSWVYFEVFEMGPPLAWVQYFGMAFILTLFVSLIFTSFFQVLTRRLAE